MNSFNTETPVGPGSSASSSTTAPDSDVIPHLESDGEDQEDHVFLTSDEDNDNVFVESGDDAVLYETDCDEEKHQKSATAHKRKLRSNDRLVIRGKFVCQIAFTRLLGVGTSTVESIRNNKDSPLTGKRLSGPKHPIFGFTLDRGSKWVGVLMFFFFVYHSACESLPREFTMPRCTQCQIASVYLKFNQ